MTMLDLLLWTKYFCFCLKIDLDMQKIRIVAYIAMGMIDLTTVLENCAKNALLHFPLFLCRQLCILEGKTLQEHRISPDQVMEAYHHGFAS